jgi:hypothetical protein
MLEPATIAARNGKDKTREIPALNIANMQKNAKD